MSLVSPTFQAIERSLDGMALRQQAHASNIANNNTPGYVQQSVDFETTLTAALQEALRPPSGLMDETSVTSARDDVMLNWKPQVQTVAQGPQRLDGNQGAIELQMSAMAFNATKYNAVTTVVTKEYQLLRTIAQAR